MGKSRAANGLSCFARDLKLCCFPDFQWDDIESNFAILVSFLGVMRNYFTLDGQHSQFELYGVFEIFGVLSLCAVLLACKFRLYFFSPEGQEIISWLFSLFWLCNMVMKLSEICNSFLHGLELIEPIFAIFRAYAI